MNHYGKSLCAIFVKDVVTELRSKQVLPTMIVLAMLIVWVMRIVSESLATNIAVMAPAVLWIAFLFSGLLTQERSFAVEEQEDCIAALLIAPIDPGTIYLAKLFVNIIILCVFEIVVVPMVLLIFQIDVAGRWIEFIAVLLLGNIGISSIGTLFSSVVQLSRTRGSLLSIIVLVILMPMMIPATFALLLLFGIIPQELAGSGALAFVGSLGAAIGYMAAFDGIFVVASWLLFGFIIKE